MRGGGELLAPALDLTPVWDAFVAHMQEAGLPPELLERPGAGLLAPGGLGSHELLSEVDTGNRLARGLRASMEGGDAQELLGRMVHATHGVTVALLQAGKHAFAAWARACKVASHDAPALVRGPRDQALIPELYTLREKGHGPGGTEYEYGPVSRNWGKDNRQFLLNWQNSRTM